MEILIIGALVFCTIMALLIYIINKQFKGAEKGLDRIEDKFDILEKKFSKLIKECDQIAK